MHTDTPNPVVLLSGRKRSGKDALASRLVRVFGFTRVAFADPLREILYALNPIVELDEDGTERRVSDLVDTLGWEEAKAVPEVRALLQRLGTEGGRAVLGDTIWVDHARKKIMAIDGPVVVTDARFPNELEALNGGDRPVVRVRIERPGHTGQGGPVDTHPSETALDGCPFDVTIVNDGTLDDLYHAADALAKALGLAPVANSRWAPTPLVQLDAGV